jgi:hypothetical protein
MCTRFKYRLNEGEIQEIELKTPIYIKAAAIIALQSDKELPILIEIWVDSLLPTYGPYFYYIFYNEYSNITINHVTKYLENKNAKS